MKIDSHLKSLATGNATGSRSKAEAAGTGSTSVAAEVQISSASAQLTKAGEGAPVDSARIAEIKLAIAEGRFKINAGAIADGLLDTARGLLLAQRKA